MLHNPTKQNENSRNEMQINSTFIRWKTIVNRKISGREWTACFVKAEVIRTGFEGQLLIRFLILFFNSLLFSFVVVPDIFIAATFAAEVSTATVFAAEVFGG